MESNILYILMSILRIPLFTVIVVILELLGIGIYLLCGICNTELLRTNEQMAYLTLISAQMFAFCIVQIIFYFQKKWNYHEALWKSRLTFVCVCTGCFLGMILITVNMLDVRALMTGQLVVLIVLTALNMLC